MQEYLNTELVIANAYYSSITAEYFQSENCTLIQLADIVANIHYSSQFNKEYKNKLEELIEKGYVKNKFTFKLNKLLHKLC